MSWPPTTPTKFRAGDVVAWCSTFHPEFRVEQVCPDGRCWIDDKWAGLVNAEDLNLLRRPVQEGDKLRVVGSVLTPAAEAGCISRYLPPTWEHADGTKIEPPRAARLATTNLYLEQPAIHKVMRFDDPVPASRPPGPAGLLSDVAEMRDQLVPLRDENVRLKVENSDLRRRVEKLERKR